jgi:Na+-transporting NADH:ubiquinone oxidoreductase subunit C
MSSDSIKKTLGVAFAVCLVGSVLVSTAAVGLKPKQIENRKADLIKNILQVSGLEYNDENLTQVYKENIVPEIIDLRTGEKISESKFTKDLNYEDFDFKKLAESKEYGIDVPQNVPNNPGIKRMPKYMIIYKVVKNGEVQKYILPIVGKGLWSTMYGFIALNKDLHTIEGLTFYEHGETPGLGGEVDNPKWKALWVGKQAYDENGNLKIRVIKGRVAKDDPNAKYEVDGLSGATLTTRGVNNLVRFWMSDAGYGPFIKKLKGEMAI